MCTARMVYPRPASAGARSRRSCTASSNAGGYGEGQVQQALLNKIELLAVRHARNVDALQRLRSSAPTKAWEDDTRLPPPDRAVDRVESGRRRPSTGDIRGRRTGGLFEGHTVPRPNSERRRSFTRVVSSTKSSWKNEPTVVEPFRSMEVHAAAWKRKVRQREEVSQIQFPLNGWWLGCYCTYPSFFFAVVGSFPTPCPPCCHVCPPRLLLYQVRGTRYQYYINSSRSLQEGKVKLALVQSDKRETRTI